MKLLSYPLMLAVIALGATGCSDKEARTDKAADILSEPIAVSMPPSVSADVVEKPLITLLIVPQDSGDSAGRLHLIISDSTETAAEATRTAYLTKVAGLADMDAATAKRLFDGGIVFTASEPSAIYPWIEALASLDKVAATNGECLSLKADSTASFHIINVVLEGLRANNLDRFSIITTLKDTD